MARLRRRRHVPVHRRAAGRRDRAARAASAGRRRSPTSTKAISSARSSGRPTTCRCSILPVQAIGKSNEHIEFPGTLTFSHETVIRAWTEIGDSVARAGCRKLVFINSHGGNVPVIDIVARELRVNHKMLAVHAAWHRLGLPDGLFSPRGARARHPRRRGRDLADARLPAADGEDGAKPRISSAPRSASSGRCKQLRVTQPIGFGWMASDLTAAGVAGDASKATLEKGEACADYAAAAFIDLLRDVARLRPRAASSRARWRDDAPAELRLRAQARAAAHGSSPASTKSGADRWPGRSAVAAVIFSLDARPPRGIDDSKKLDRAQREALLPLILESALSVSIAFASAEEIDRHNIRGATLAGDGARRRRPVAAPAIRAHRRPRPAGAAALPGAARSSTATRCRCRSPPPPSSPKLRATG